MPRGGPQDILLHNGIGHNPKATSPGAKLVLSRVIGRPIALGWKICIGTGQISQRNWIEICNCNGKGIRFSYSSDRPQRVYFYNQGT